MNLITAQISLSYTSICAVFYVKYTNYLKSENAVTTTKYIYRHFSYLLY